MKEQDYDGPLSARALGMLQHLLRQGIVEPAKTRRQASLFDDPLPARDNLHVEVKPAPVESSVPERSELGPDPLAGAVPQAEPEPELVSDASPPAVAPQASSRLKMSAWVRGVKTPDFGARYEQWRKVPFSRESYHKEVRGNALGGMLLSTGLTFGLAAGIVGGTVSYLLPKREELLARKAELERLPAEISTVQGNIKNATVRLQQIERDARLALEGLPLPAEVFGAYSQFLYKLEASRVSLRRQLLSTSTTEANPLTLPPADGTPVAVAAPARPNAPAGTPAGNAAADAAARTLGLPSNPGAGSLPPPAAGGGNAGTAQAKPGAQPAAQALPVPPSLRFGPGLNYYHFVIDIEGPYLAYLAARQELVNALPALVVHQERVTSSPDKPQVVVVAIKASIPFTGRAK